MKTVTKHNQAKFDLGSVLEGRSSTIHRQSEMAQLVQSHYHSALLSDLQQVACCRPSTEPRSSLLLAAIDCLTVSAVARRRLQYPPTECWQDRNQTRETATSTSSKDLVRSVSRCRFVRSRLAGPRPGVRCRNPSTMFVTCRCEVCWLSCLWMEVVSSLSQVCRRRMCEMSAGSDYWRRCLRKSSLHQICPGNQTHDSDAMARRRQGTTTT